MTSRRVTVLLFEGFELLDVFGPVELLHLAPGIEVDFVSLRRGLVRSSQGVQVMAERGAEELDEVDILLVPGGIGTRTLVDDQAFLGWLQRRGERARMVASVCTGSALLAAAGLLEGRRATSNKRAWDWASRFGTDVDWQPRARWVADGDRWTSSGIGAGIDMTAALLRELVGDLATDELLDRAEITVQTDPGIDPFAATTD